MRSLADGSFLVQPDEALRPYPTVLSDRVQHWAKRFPDRICIAKRDARGEWRQLTYAQVFESVRRIGQALLNRRLSAGRPIAILSENDLEQNQRRETQPCDWINQPLHPLLSPQSWLCVDNDSSLTSLYVLVGTKHYLRKSKEFSTG